MKLFKSKMSNRLAISKGLGFMFWLFAFFMIPIVSPKSDLYIRFAVLFWYITFGFIIGIVWIIKVHPVFKWFKIPWWFRWIIIWAWLNFVASLFVYHLFENLIIWTIFEWLSPFCLVFEWAIIWFIIDFFATKFVWDWKKICE